MWERIPFTIPDLKIKKEQEQQESQMHSNTLAPSALRRNFVEKNIFCDASTPRRIVEENILPRPNEFILYGRQKFVNQSTLFSHIRTLWNPCSNLRGDE